MLFDLILKVLLLIIFSLLGFICGKFIKLRAFDISNLMIYVISPVVIFVSIIHSPSSAKYIAYSGYAFLFSSCSALISYAIARRFWCDSRVNLFAFAGGTGNTGYFALPIAFSLFDPAQISIAVFIVIGVNLYEFTVGYFLTASGHATLRESLNKVCRMPILYAAILAMLCKVIGIPLNPTVLDFMNNFKGAYSVLGMMVIGISLAAFDRLELDYVFTLLIITWKHLLLPAVGILIFRFVIPLDPPVLAVVALMLATPMAGNVVVISSQLNVHPEKAALSVMLSTFMALFFIPVVVWCILQ